MLFRFFGKDCTSSKMAESGNMRTFPWYEIDNFNCLSSFQQSEARRRHNAYPDRSDETVLLTWKASCRDHGEMLSNRRTKFVCFTHSPVFMFDTIDDEIVKHHLVSFSHLLKLKLIYIALVYLNPIKLLFCFFQSRDGHYLECTGCHENIAVFENKQDIIKCLQNHLDKCHSGLLPEKFICRTCGRVSLFLSKLSDFLKINL